MSWPWWWLTAGLASVTLTLSKEYAESVHGCPTFRLPRVPERRVVGGGATAGSGEEIFEWMDEGSATFDALLGTVGAMARREDREVAGHSRRGS